MAREAAPSDPATKRLRVRASNSEVPPTHRLYAVPPSIFQRERKKLGLECSEIAHFYRCCRDLVARWDAGRVAIPRIALLALPLAARDKRERELRHAREARKRSRRLAKLLEQEHERARADAIRVAEGVKDPGAWW